MISVWQYDECKVNLKKKPNNSQTFYRNKTNKKITLRYINELQTGLSLIEKFQITISVLYSISDTS